MFLSREGRKEFCLWRTKKNTGLKEECLHYANRTEQKRVFEHLMAFKRCCFRMRVRKAKLGCSCIFKDATLFMDLLCLSVSCITERLVRSPSNPLCRILRDIMRVRWDLLPLAPAADTFICFTQCEGPAMCCVYWNILCRVLQPMWISDVCCFNVCVMCVFRLDPLHQWDECERSPAGWHTVWENHQQQLGCGLQSAHHHTPPNDVWKWGEILHLNFILFFFFLGICGSHQTTFCAVTIEDPA